MNACYASGCWLIGGRGGTFTGVFVALQCADADCVCLVLQQDVERLDPRGRTPLELAVCLGHLESSRVLLRHTADPTHCNAQGWTSKCWLLLSVSVFPGSPREWRAPAVIKCGCVPSVLQEAVSTGDPELVQLVLQYRDFKRATERLAGIPELLSKLRQVKPLWSVELSNTANLHPLLSELLNGVFYCFIIF